MGNGASGVVGVDRERPVGNTMLEHTGAAGWLLHPARGSALVCAAAFTGAIVLEDRSHVAGVLPNLVGVNVLLVVLGSTLVYFRRGCTSLV